MAWATAATCDTYRDGRWSCRGTHGGLRFNLTLPERPNTQPDVRAGVRGLDACAVWALSCRVAGLHAVLPRGLRPGFVWRRLLNATNPRPDVSYLHNGATRTKKKDDMRKNIVHPGAGNLSYEIREIVAVGHEDSRPWVSRSCGKTSATRSRRANKPPNGSGRSFTNLWTSPAPGGYCDTAGVPATREFLSERCKRARRRRAGDAGRHRLLQRSGRRGGQGVRLPAA